MESAREKFALYPRSNSESYGSFAELEALGNAYLRLNGAMAINTALGLLLLYLCTQIALDLRPYAYLFGTLLTGCSTAVMVERNAKKIAAILGKPETWARRSTILTVATSPVFFGSIGIILIQNAAATELRNYCGKPRGGFGSGYTENQIKGKLMEMSETKRPDPREIDYSQPPSISLR